MRKMRKLTAMEICLKMDRPIDKDKYYICPGGYELNGKYFDFSYFEGYVDEKDPTIINFILKEYDETLGSDDTPTYITKFDIKRTFDEFYVYTGENDEPEIYVNKILFVNFYFDEEKVCASEKTLRSANGCIYADTAKVGDLVSFDNGLVEGDGEIIKISTNNSFKKFNGEITRFVLKFGEYTHICSPSEVSDIKRLS